MEYVLDFFNVIVLKLRVLVLKINKSNKYQSALVFKIGQILQALLQHILTILHNQIQPFFQRSKIVTQ